MLGKIKEFHKFSNTYTVSLYNGKLEAMVSAKEVSGLAKVGSTVEIEDVILDDGAVPTLENVKVVDQTISQTNPSTMSQHWIISKS